MGFRTRTPTARIETLLFGQTAVNGVLDQSNADRFEIPLALTMPALQNHHEQD
jgi:hypothetical protein